MVEIHVVRAENKHLYVEEMERCYRLRHQIYVDERKWLDLARWDGREIDQFDTDDTIYLLAIDDAKIVGHMRMIPTDKPTLLSELFPQLSLQGPIRRSDAYEMSRIFVVHERRGESFGPKIEAML